MKVRYIQALKTSVFCLVSGGQCVTEVKRQVGAPRKRGAGKVLGIKMRPAASLTQHLLQQPQNECPRGRLPAWRPHIQQTTVRPAGLCCTSCCRGRNQTPRGVPRVSEVHICQRLLEDTHPGWGWKQGSPALAAWAPWLSVRMGIVVTASHWVLTEIEGKGDQLLLSSLHVSDAFPSVCIFSFWLLSFSF